MDKKAELVKYLATQGIINPADADAEIAKMAAQIPTATAAQKGLTDDVDKAYEVMQIKLGTQITDPSVGTPNSVLPTTGVSAAEQTNISKKLYAQQEQRIATSQNSTIDQYIFDRPAPSEIIPQGTTGLIKEKSFNDLMARVNKGELKVCPDDGDDVDAAKRIASTTNFNALKEAFEKKQPVDVYVGKLATRPIGYMVRKGTSVGTSAPEQMTREELKDFLTLETAGYILSNGTNPGAKLKSVKAKNSVSAPGQTEAKKTVLADANKAAAIENNCYQISRQVTSEKVTSTCKSALQVRFVEVGKTLKDGVTPKTVVKRVSVAADIFTTERKAEFVDKFNSTNKDAANALTEAPTANQARDIMEAQVRAIAELRQKAKDPQTSFDVAKYADQLSAFDGAAQGANVAM